MSRLDLRRMTGVAAVPTVGSDLWGIGAAGALLVVLVLLFAGDTFTLNLLATAFLFGGLATAWNIIGGFGGQFSIGHSVFFAVGAYVTANLYLKLGISPWIGLLPAALAAAAIATVVSWPVFRLRGPFFAIATMAFTEVALALAIYLEGLTGGARGLTIPFRQSAVNMIFRQRMDYTWLMLGFLVFTMLMASLVYRSRLGYYLQAVRDNENAAVACGVRTLRTKLLGMAASAALTGVGGGLFMMYVRVADPMSLISLFDVGVKIVLITLIGGIGTIYGPLLGAMFVVWVESWLRAEMGGQLPGAHLIVLGVVLVLAARFMKTGITGALQGLWRRLRARPA